MKDVQCYELFGGIALENTHAFEKLFYVAIRSIFNIKVKFFFQLGLWRSFFPEQIIILFFFISRN